MTFDDYELSPSIYDEMFLPPDPSFPQKREPRPHARLLFDALNDLSSTDLASIQSRVNRTFSNESISFTVYGDPPQVRLGGTDNPSGPHTPGNHPRTGRPSPKAWRSASVP